jgi:hypothetical protein
MEYLNQFHKESVERKILKIEESKKLPKNSEDVAKYMRSNMEIAANM